MANANRITGLSPVKHITGAPYNGQVNVYAIPAASTKAFAIGDPVVATGKGGAPDGTPYCDLAAATGAIRGVIVGITDQTGGMAKVANPDITYRPAAAQTGVWYALVADAPDLIFEVQESGTEMVAADVGKNANLAVGTHNKFVSGWTVNGASKGTLATLQVHLLGLVQRPDNDYGAYAKWLVRINNHELAAGTGTAT